MSCEKYMYAYRNRDTGLWWNRLNKPDTDDLRCAALFATKVKGDRLAPIPRYESVKIKVTLEEIE